MAVNAETLDVAVTGDDSKVHVYQLTGTELTLKTEIEHLGPVTDCSYSPDLKYLVASDANRKVILYSVAEYKVSKNGDACKCTLSMFVVELYLYYAWNKRRDSLNVDGKV